MNDRRRSCARRCRRIRPISSSTPPRLPRQPPMTMPASSRYPIARSCRWRRPAYPARAGKARRAGLTRAISPCMSCCRKSMAASLPMPSPSRSAARAWPALRRRRSSRWPIASMRPPISRWPGCDCAGPKPPARRVALVLANYPNRDGRLANGVGLDTPQSLIDVLAAMRGEGYLVGEAPDDAAAMMDLLQEGPTNALDGRASRVWRRGMAARELRGCVRSSAGECAACR